MNHTPEFKRFIKNRNRIIKKDLIQRLKVLFKYSAIKHWMDTPNAVFYGMTPRDMIDLGEFELIENMLLEFEYGIF